MSNYIKLVSIFNARKFIAITLLMDQKAANKMETSSCKQQTNNVLQRKSIYVRTANKNTIRLEVDQSIKTEDIKANIVKRFQLKLNEFVLFYEGKELSQLSSLENLKNNAIIHLVNINQVQKQEINVYFKDIHSQRLIQVHIKTNDQIKIIFQRQIKQKIGKQISQVFLVYLGKILNVNSTFTEEFVQSQCEILITYVKRKTDLQTSFKTINHSHQIVLKQFQASIKVGMPYKQSRSLADHQNSKRKQIQKLQKRQMNKQSISVSLKKIQEKSPENEIVIPDITFKENLGLEQDISYQISRLAGLKIQDSSQKMEELSKDQRAPLPKYKEA